MGTQEKQEESRPDRLVRDDRRQRKKQKSSRKAGGGKGHFLRNAALILLILLLAVFLYVAIGMGREYFGRTDQDAESVEVTIEKGEGISEITQRLKKTGVIQYGLPFIVRVYATQNDGNIRYGTYELKKGMALDDIITALTTEGARKDQYTFVVPEGYSAEMIARRLENYGVMTAEEFLSQLKAYKGEFAFDDVLPAEDTVNYTLQGFLYPDTYYLDDEVTAFSLIRMMLENFEKHFDEERQKKAAAMGMTAFDVVNRAALVQKETILPEEYGIVADVIQNRLDINMNLQMDSTVVYAMTNGLFGKEKVYHKDLQFESPYNTYLHKGMPPGPIANPGIEAIDGVLNPDDNDYLFFQTDSSRTDGANLYFETYEEHSAAQATTETSGETEEGTTAEVSEEADGH